MLGIGFLHIGRNTCTIKVVGREWMFQVSISDTVVMIMVCNLILLVTRWFARELSFVA